MKTFRLILLILALILTSVAVAACDIIPLPFGEKDEDANVTFEFFIDGQSVQTQTIELKELTSESGLAEKFVEVIADYKGEYIVESFNPMTLRRLRKLRPDMLRGILSTTYTKEDKYKGKILYYLGEKLLLNFFMRPNFISYIHTGYTTRNLGFIRRVFDTPLLTWTVKSQEEENAAYSHGFDTVIFEGYIPEK